MARIQILAQGLGDPFPVAGAVTHMRVGDRTHDFILQEDAEGKPDTLTHLRSGARVADLRPVMQKHGLSPRPAAAVALEEIVARLGVDRVNQAMAEAPVLNPGPYTEALSGPWATKARFLEEYEKALVRLYAWAEERVKKDEFLAAARDAIYHPELPVAWHHGSPAARDAWRALGGRSRPTLQALRALAEGEPT